jgi:hypothetical protein
VIKPTEVGAKAWLRELVEGWDHFWFTPRQPHTLAVIRIFCGGMLAYVHLVWACVVNDYMGPNAWVTADVVRQLHRNDWGWSWLWYVENPSLLFVHQLIAVAVSLMMMVGCLTRISTAVAWWLTLMVCHRLTGALFGLDQVVVMLSTYLMFSRCGSVLSVDAWLRNRFPGRRLFPAESPSISNNVATRLIQLHLCVIYLFGGLSKMRGEMWFDGSAMWYTAVNYEYQSMDITWLGQFPFLIAALTAGTIFWETFYCALVWPRLTRPLTLLAALFVHGGIALALGMVTFGTIMIVANMAFIEPRFFLSLKSRVSRKTVVGSKSHRNISGARSIK